MKRVLFLCTGNSARSIMAEAILNHRANERIEAYSAGSHPVGEVNPLALELLRSLGIDASAARSKSWDEFGGEGAKRMDYVITVCNQAASESCPLWPGGPQNDHWDIPDPAAAKGSREVQSAAFREVYGMLDARLDELIEALLEAP